MDRRQRKTREAVLNAFSRLMFQKEFHKITVEEIIREADVGRATFYAHFETRDFLLKALCEELFCHVFDLEQSEHVTHRHIFDCHETEEAFLHLFRHFKKNDHNLRTLLSSQNSELFLRYFRENLDALVAAHLPLFEARKPENVPLAFWKNHIAATFLETLRYWVENGMTESPEEIAALFFAVT